jgi:methionyl aminopeptidase
MGIILKTPEEIEQMRVAGQMAGEVLRMIGPHVQPGIRTAELDEICHQYITEHQKAIPAPLDYRGFPRSICTSVNHVICHGIPGEKRLKDGIAVPFEPCLRIFRRSARRGRMLRSTAIHLNLPWR